MLAISKFLIDIFLVLSIFLVPFIGSIAFEEVSSLQIWITVSSLARKDPNNNKALLFRQIELNWINAPNEAATDYIALYLDSQPEDNKLPVSVHRLNGRMNGHFTTDYYLPLIDFYNETTTSADVVGDGDYSAPQYFGPRGAPEGVGEAPSTRLWRQHNNNYEDIAREKTSTSRAGGQQHLVGQCLGYCIAYHSRNKILARSCLQTRPTWMEESFAYIGSRALPTLMLPGTHNSGTYPKLLDRSVLQMINKYQMNQDESIFNQLVFGIRHLDLRVGYTKVKQRHERLWVYHDIFRTEVSLEEVFKQVARFLDLTSHELVIMDFHRFTVGFQNETPAVQRERHARLIELLFKHLSKYIVPSYLGQHAPLNEYVSMGKRLLVGYADRSALIGAQAADQHSSIFALYTQQASGHHLKTHSVRDIDAIKQDQDDQLLEQPQQQQPGEDGGLEQDSEQQQQATDRRMGTRIYNKLKSLKLISHSFSKRSIPEETMKLSRPKWHANLMIQPVKPQQQQQHFTATRDIESANYEDIRGAGHQDDHQQDDHDDDLAVVARAALFFAPVRHLWPNKDTIDGLAQYMNETTCRKYFGELRSLMVELTPTVFGAISDKYDGLRRLAQLSNRPVTDWIRDRWLHCVNIVASDYFLGNDLIRLAVQANKMRQLRRTSGPNELGGGGGGDGAQCRSFRRIEHLLDKTKIAQQYLPVSGHHQQQPDDAINLITHTTSNGNKIFLKPMRSGPPSTATSSTSASTSTTTTSTSSLTPTTATTNSFQQSRDSTNRRESFVDNVSEGIVDLFTSFKRLLNL